MRLPPAQLPHSVELSPWLWVAGAGIVMLVTLLVVLARRRRREAAFPPPARHMRRAAESSRHADGDADGGDADSVDRLHLDSEMHALARELSAMIEAAGEKIDARAERLRDLIRAADERITELRQLREEPGADAPARDRHARRDHNDGDEPDEVVGGRMTIEPCVVSASPTTTTGTGTEAASSDGIDPRHAQIYALSADGLSIQQIADRLGRPKGEIELILALRPRGRAAV